MLCRSHIIPEFFFKPLYDEKGRYHQYSADPEQKTLVHQKGLREYLFCRECEDRFRVWEPTRNTFSSEDDLARVSSSRAA